MNDMIICIGRQYGSGGREIGEKLAARLGVTCYDKLLLKQARMKYINAKDLLPDALVKELQRYMQGGYLYIPADQAQKKRWGEASGYRQELQQRNRKIVEEFQNGSSMEALAEKYFLSVSAIRKIIYQK